MKRNKLLDILSGVFLAVQVVAEVLVGAFIARLNMLPALYSILLIIFGILLVAGTGALLFLGNRAKRGFQIRRCIGWVLVVLVVVGCMVAATVAADVYETLYSMTTPPPAADGIVRTVVVLKDDPAQTLQDAAEYRFGIVSDYDTYYTEKAIEDIETQLGKKVTLVQVDSMAALVNALTGKQVGAIILGQGILETVKEIEEYKTLPDQIRYLYNAVIPEAAVDPVDPTDPTDPTGSSDPTDPSDPDDDDPPRVTIPSGSGSITERPFVVYISGSDSRDTVISNSGRSDVNILAVVNPKTKQVLLITTPRDAYIPNPALGGGLDKLTHCGNNGVNNTIRALENLYSVSVDYNVRINFTGFETMIDAIGGITVDVPFSFTSGQDAGGVERFEKGQNLLDGRKALIFARERAAFTTGDFERGRNQMRVIKAVINKVTTSPAIIANYSGILDSMKNMFTMRGLTMNDISSLVKMQITDMAEWDVFSYDVQGDSYYRETASWKGVELSVVELYTGHLNKATNLIARMMAGEKLTNV